MKEGFGTLGDLLKAENIKNLKCLAERMKEAKEG
ncbi:hypothetical protein ZOSMA_19G00840 [Zostera marina]|uniref:Uncharacterized protein n=1 Tax=Zostera marina TaxID=29655 RepID=A0A0K9PNF0_ZOSMR|nr:hypothetical protein ZOSMA_19G00840 [Zostera marina]